MDHFDLRKYLAEGRLYEENDPYKYAFLYDGEELNIFTQQDFDDYVEEMAEDDFDGNKKDVIKWMKNDNILEKLPNKPYLFIFANDESIDYLVANTKEEFIEILNSDYFEDFSEDSFEGDSDEMFQQMLNHANNSEISGDSGFAEVVIENGKIIAGPSDVTGISKKSVNTRSKKSVNTRRDGEVMLDVYLRQIYRGELSPQADLDLSNTIIKDIPAGMEVGGNLYIDNTDIKELPWGLSTLFVQGNLSASNSKVTTVSKKIKVGGDLNLTNTPFSKKYSKEEIRQMLPGVKGDILV